MSTITLNQHRAGVSQTIIKKFSDENEPKSGFSAFFPTITTESKLIGIEVERNLDLIAVDVQRCTDPVRNTFSKSQEKLFEPPYYNEFFDFTSCQRYDETFGRGNTPTKVDAQMLISDGYKKAQALKNKIKRAIEKQRSQVLQTGVVLLKNGDSIDYKRQAASLKVLTGANRWFETNSNPLLDIAEGMAFIREEGKSGSVTINAILGKRAFNDFMSNPKVKEVAEIRRIERLALGMPQFDNVSGMAFHGQFGAGDFQINIWTYNESYIDIDGIRKNYLDADTVVMVADDFVGSTTFAGVPAIMNAGGSQYIAPKAGEFYVRDVIDQIKLSWQFIVSSAPLVVPVSIDRIYTIKTR